VFRKLLVANRGEIAVRVLRACKELGIRTVAVFSEADENAPHARLADEALACGPADPRRSYLSIEGMIAAAKRAGADALHPGYGFLSENSELAEACATNGITFVGPPAEVIRRMGSKLEARRAMQAAGVMVVPGTQEPLGDDEARSVCEAIGYPVMLKASAGGGGRGMRLVKDAKGLAKALPRARSEAQSAFGDDSLYVEKALENPRHIEIQVLADAPGEVVHLYERECSIQRRHQKLLEEAPAPGLDAGLLAHMTAAAVTAARSVGYVGAGTVEFLVCRDSFYFLEMNTRIQVEHTITEMRMGVDLVQAQLRIASGERLPFSQDELCPRGHAIEARIYAENPEKQFFPSPGTLRVWRPPVGAGIRVDSGVEEGSEVTPYYDPLLAKLVVYGADRGEAVARLCAALQDFRVEGPATSLAFHRWVVDDPDFQAGRTDTGFVPRLLARRADSP